MGDNDERTKIDNDEYAKEYSAIFRRDGLTK